jgi:hypothetical protein
MLEGINYWGAVTESPSQLEICFAIFANVLELDDQGDLVNEKHAERRAATWLYRYCTGELPPGEADLEPWECTAATRPPGARPPADSGPYAPSSDTQAFRIRFRSSSRAKCIDDATPGRWSRCRDMAVIRRMAQGGITGQRIVPARARVMMPS